MIFKLIKWLVILIVLAVIVGIGGLYLALGGILKRIVQTEGTAQLHVPTTVGSASLGLVGGSVGFQGLALGSPTGFTAPQMFSVGGLTVKTAGVTHLLDNPLHVTDIEVDAPHLWIEQKGTTLNFKVMMDGLPKGGGGGSSGPASADKNPVRLVIDTLAVNSPVVDFIPDPVGTVSGMAGKSLGALGELGKQAAAVANQQLAKRVKPMTLNLGSLKLTNIGNADGKMQGVEIKDVATAVIQAMATEAAKEHNLPIDPSLMSGNLDSVKGKLGGGAGKLLDGILGGNK